MEIITIKQRLDALEAAVAKLSKQPAPEPSVKSGPAEPAKEKVADKE